jgi:hypothetical protein
MPVHTTKDTKGCYAQWGDHGARYYYECGNKEARQKAKASAYKQGLATGEFVVEMANKGNKKSKC